MKQISSIVFSIATVILLAGAMTATAHRKEASTVTAPTAEGLMPEVVAVAAGPNQVVGEIVIRSTAPGTLADNATPLPAVN
jgi:hypothetical protein